MPAPKKKTVKPTGGPTKPGPKSKTKQLVCSKAMSAWKSTGTQTPEVRKILAECRSKASGKLNYMNVGQQGQRTTKVNTPKEAKESRKMTAKQIEESEHKMIEEGRRAEHEAFGGKRQTFVTGHGGEHSKHMNKSAVGLAGNRVADAAEHHIANILGGKVISGNKAGDVLYEVPGEGGKVHYVEVKTKTSGEEQELKLHASAVHRKALKTKKTGHEFHTIVIDMRDKHLGGEFEKYYSGHRYYYMRGVDVNNRLDHFHKITDPEKQIHKLLNMPEDEIPTESARKGFLKMTDDQMQALGKRGARNKATRNKHQSSFGARRAELNETLAQEMKEAGIKKISRHTPAAVIHKLQEMKRVREEREAAVRA